MRMIGIGLMGFLLAGVALLLSNMNIVEQGQRMVRELATGPQLVFEPQLEAQADGTHTATILRSNPDHPVILSGFPAYQSVAFTFPKDARPSSGYLQIDATAQVLAGVHGVLRISIMGTRRGELLLRPGEVGRSLQIPLSPPDFAGDQLVVSFSLQGTDPQQQCGPEDGIAAIVEIETTSAVFVTLDQPLSTARDRVHAWGDTVRVAWPAWLKRDEQVRRLILAVQAKQHGLRAQFIAQGEKVALSTVALREALDDLPVADPVPSAAFLSGAATQGVRRFHRKTVWRNRYALVDGADLPVPSQMHLRMVMGDLFGDHQWSLTVTLNDRLVWQDRVHGTHGTYQAQIALPAEWQTSRNQIDVVATTSAPRNGVCDEGPELVAEMLPETQLVHGTEVYAGPIAALRHALEVTDPISLSLSAPLTAQDADKVAGWLARVVPPDAALRPAQRAAHLIVADARDAPSPLQAGQSAWIVTQGNDGSDVLVRPLQRGDAYPRAGVFLLIVPAGLDLSEGAT